MGTYAEMCFDSRTKISVLALVYGIKVKSTALFIFGHGKEDWSGDDGSIIAGVKSFRICFTSATV